MKRLCSTRIMADDQDILTHGERIGNGVGLARAIR
jgi:hypothetical protein